MAWCWASEQKVLQLVNSLKGLYVSKIISFRTWLLKTLKGLSDLLRCLYNGASHSSCKDQNWSSFLLQRPGKNPVAIKIKQLPRFLFLLFSQETPLLSSSDCQLRFRPITPPVVHIFKFCWNASIIKNMQWLLSHFHIGGSSEMKRAKEFWAPDELKLWVSSAERAQACQSFLRALFEPKLSSDENYQIQSRACIELFWKLGLSSLKPGAYLLWAKN